MLVRITTPLLGVTMLIATLGAGCSQCSPATGDVEQTIPTESTGPAPTDGSFDPQEPPVAIDVPSPNELLAAFRTYRPQLVTYPVTRASLQDTDRLTLALGLGERVTDLALAVGEQNAAKCRLLADQMLEIATAMGFGTQAGALHGEFTGALADPVDWAGMPNRFEALYGGLRTRLSSGEGDQTSQIVALGTWLQMLAYGSRLATEVPADAAGIAERLHTPELAEYFESVLNSVGEPLSASPRIAALRAGVGSVKALFQATPSDQFQAPQIGSLQSTVSPLLVP